jgi:hypothetical protein
VIRVEDPGFDPWRSIEDHPDLQVTFHPVARLMGGGFQVAWAERSFIVLDPDLDEPLRRVVLTHELIHHERGGGPHGSPSANRLLQVLTARDEHSVEAEVARRLIPAGALVAFVREQVAGGDGVRALEVSAHFGVPLDVAECALRQLVARTPARAPRSAAAA